MLDARERIEAGGQRNRYSVQGQEGKCDPQQARLAPAKRDLTSGGDVTKQAGSVTSAVVSLDQELQFLQRFGRDGIARGDEGTFKGILADTFSFRGQSVYKLR